MLRLFSSINDSGQTILMVTLLSRRRAMQAGCFSSGTAEVFHQIYRGTSTNEQLYQKISDTLTLLATGGDRE